MEWTVYNDLVTETVNGVSGVVVKVPWICSKTVDGKTIHVHGSTDLTANPSSPDFVPYNDLTQAQVISWVKDVLGADGVTYYENQADENLTMFEEGSGDNTMDTFPPAYDPVATTKSSLPW